MRWNVEGADAHTGNERMIQVTADNKAQAEAKARQQGLLVSAVHESSVLTPAEALDEMVGGSIRERTAQATTAAAYARAAPAPVEYRSPRTSAAVPDYFGLRFASVMLRVFALLFYLAGALGLVGALFTVVNSIGSRDAAFGMMSAFAQLILVALGPLAAGAVMHGFSAGCVALRDIARNSYR